ncbi:MAG: uracil-DNA glycosylase [SAR324 cluster bacterium]|nr:uracil-DNA glycosylase [SAR324 cluster bacterium]
MNYTSLLLQIENQLLSLNKKGLNYINIGALPDVELKRVIDGLEEMFSSENAISQETRETKNKPSEKSEKFEENTNENTEIGINPEPADLTDQNKVLNLKQQNITRTFAQIAKQQDSAKKINTLSDLFEKYKACQKCALGKTRKNLVFGRGLSNPPVMFIGEGPGAEEDTQGEPFVGRAGRLLTKMISAIGIERADVYITNIVKCRPPDNRNPTPAEISCCLPIIKQQIEILNPKLIVTLGNIPTKTLIPDLPGITKARGKIKQYEKWTVLPTFHPSYLLRNRSAMPQAWEDFKKITEFAFNSKQG